MDERLRPRRRARRAPSPVTSRGPSRRRSPAAVEHALATGEHLLAEAGTGVGKSLAYLVPALESGQRVVVATATKALQEQLLAKDVPVAAAALGRDVDVRVLKGRANYLCRRQLQGFQPFLLADGRDARGLGGDAAVARRDGDRRPRGARRSSRRRRSGPSCRSAPTGAPAAAVRSSRRCFAEAARERAAHADLVIVNHALYFAHLASGGGVLPEHDAVVFDEAHRLEETRRLVARRAGLARRGSGGSRSTSSAPAGRPSSPSRRGRSTASSAPASGSCAPSRPPSGRRAAA